MVSGNDSGGFVVVDVDESLSDAMARSNREDNLPTFGPAPKPMKARKSLASQSEYRLNKNVIVFKCLNLSITMW